MANVDMKALVGALDAACVGALNQAALVCAERGQYEITVDDFLRALLETRDFQAVLAQFGKRAEPLTELLDRHRAPAGKTSDRPVFSPLLRRHLQEAYLLASLELGQRTVSAPVLVLALLKNPNSYGFLPFYKELRDIPPAELQTLIEGGIQEREGRAGGGIAADDPEDCLRRYTTDFTAEARAGGTDPVFARGPEIRLMVDILTRRRKNNPILVGDPGVGKTAVVEGLALKVAEGTVPDALKKTRIVGLDMGRLQAGAGVKGEFEKRLKGVVDAVKASPVPTILFIDEAHTLVGSGNAAGSGDGANLLKPALARGELRTIAATTWGEYKKYFEKDAALARRFQPVKLNEPSPEETVAILRGIVPYYEKAHGVYIRDDAVVKTAELAGRYISGRQLPDKAIDVLDTACARVRVSLGATPPRLEALEERRAATARELDALARDNARGNPASAARETAARQAELTAALAALDQEISHISGRWRQERGLVDRILHLRTGESPQTEKNGTDGGTEAFRMDALAAELQELQADGPLVHYEVSPRLVAGIVAEWTGIPEGKLDGGGEAALSTLRDRLRKRIRGQEYALEIIEKAVVAAHAGLGSPTKPGGVFLLAGPSGVGKTETALAVAEELFGGERLLVSINMSEFQEKHMVSRLIGSPPGYVGYGEGGRLTEAIRRQPYSVVLFDEVEKAHPDVLNLFYQIFDKGVLADGEGREVDFRNTLIFMTSNLGEEIIADRCAGEAQGEPGELLEALRPVLLRFFKPALFARMTVVPYLPIRPAIIRELALMKLGQTADRMRRRHRIPLEWEDAVIDTIAESCTAVDTGARNIDAVINFGLLPGIASTFLGGLGGDGKRWDKLAIGVDAETSAFTFSLKAAG
ncbi:MAG: type VI secretion system ATPase TssH [Deltaproteobacteria bacterium]|jgi:type VI secretion system protein VasG|nr:type VI secretion system ATPase TssH [Deltaproteobacteria bacterium]